MAEPNLFPRDAKPEEHIKKQTPDTEFLSRISKNVNNLAASLKILEERYSTLRNRTQVSEQNMVDMEKELSKDVKMVSEEVVELKHEISEVRDKLGLISREIGNLVNKNDFRIMERYLEMWQPMNFVTRKELNKMILDAKEEEVKEKTPGQEIPAKQSKDSGKESSSQTI